MSYHEQLTAEIHHRLLDALEAEKRPWHPTWVAHEICRDHTPGLAENEHADFWRHGGYTTTRELVTKCINKRAGKGAAAASDDQLALAGFEYIQAYYVIKRDDEYVAVHRDRLTDEEIEAKALDLEADAKSLRAHANELRRYKTFRTSVEITRASNEAIA